MPSSDRLGKLNAKINSVIARLEQDGIRDVERKALERAIDQYIAARGDLLLDDLDGAAAHVKAGDSELAKVTATNAGGGSARG
jgi:hypothetical protein